MKTQNKSQSKSKVPKEGLFPEIIRNDYQGSRKLQEKSGHFRRRQWNRAGSSCSFCQKELMLPLSTKKVTMMPEKPEAGRKRRAEMYSDQRRSYPKSFQNKMCG
jgi:hypothetical protein